MGERYIQLNGDAVNEPLSKAFHRAASVKIAAIVGALHYTSMIFIHKPEPLIGLITLATTALGYGASVMSTRLFTNYLLRNTFGDTTDRCIDTKPGNKAIPLEFNDLRSAYKCWYVSIFASALLTSANHRIFLGTSSRTVSDCIQFLTLPEILPYAGVMAVPMVTMAQNAIRFGALIHGDYTIVKTPPSESKNELVSNFAYNPT